MSKRWMPGDERGASMVLILLMLVVLLSAGALAVDVGMLLTARSDAQRAADAAALAGASAFVDGAPVAEAAARATATAGQNGIFGGPIRPEEVQVQTDPAAAVVRVVVRRTQIGTFFARMLGVQSSGIVASAAAEAIDAPTASCAKPFSPPDPLLTEGESIVGKVTGKAKGALQGGGSGSSQKKSDFTYGEAIVLHGKKGGAESVSWDVPLDAGFSGGCHYQANGSINSGPTLRANICNCNNSTVRIGEEYSLLNGQKTGPMNQGIDALLGLDPHAHWDASKGRVVGSEADNWRRGPRVVTIPLHDPASVGSGTVTFTRYVTVFVEGGSFGALNGRYLGSVRSLRLIE